MVPDPSFHRGKGWFRPLSLRARLILVSGLFIGFCVLFSAFLLFHQHRLAVVGAEIAIMAHEEMATAVSLREALAQIDRYAQAGDVNTLAINQFRRLLQVLESTSTGLDHEGVVRIKSEFEKYAEALNRIHTPLGGITVKSRYEDVSAAVGALIEENELSAYRMADHLRKQQEGTTQRSVLWLMALVSVVIYSVFKLVTILTEPLSSLVRFLDNVQIEDDLPETIPQFSSPVPEVTSVAGSFERLLQRLRGYRALNIRRLLIEKRRADIIAASISDGICLLRNDEILYLNPIAEKILGISGKSFSKGLSLRGLLNRPEGDTTRNRGAEAILTAVSRTMPVEFILESEDRKHHYLIQAYNISFDLIEKVEHAVNSGPIDHILDKFQANTMILAQDMTLVKEGQEAKSHFLATLSHEIKTPVTSLTMATRLLRRSIEEIPNATHRSLITTCADDVDRLRVLLDDLLTVSRFDTLTQKMELQNADLGKLVKHSVQSFIGDANERGISLSQKIARSSDRSLVIPMDPAKIAWAVSNLLTNALRHTPRGGKVDVAVELEEGWVLVRVRDSGPGIEVNRQEKIFDKYNSYYNIRIARSGGAGAGLAIAREIVVAHGGRIWVSSVPGRGAEFSFKLPTKSGQSIETQGNRPGFETRLTQNLNSKKGAIGGTTARS